ncbi:sugar transferase [Dyadobacter pollutisoli]|jgi:hypothetical protein|uniref:Sugar transferase n=1 Tax=Dyadobacter pollutisoli TaxID=2910158 RepID=A0A9E8NCB1_9BACT|nr:sugar transferase [Dyadobacter pollutisoli]WAC11921.1 sugar transferase [Dyadobacter pollutisoli]
MAIELAPILLFVYNRPDQTRKTLEALADNSLADQSQLFIYADGPKRGTDTAGLQKIEGVRNVIAERQWCKHVTIIKANSNKGLANSIIDGVTEKINEYGKVIVLEDDLVTSKGFIKFMNDALDKYQSDEKVMQVSGHQFPLNIPPNHSSFFLPLTTSWGWATWKRAWDHFDSDAKGYEILKKNRSLAQRFDLNSVYPYSKMLVSQMEGKDIDSWAIRWYWAVFKENGISLFPDKSLVQNIGFGILATHTSGSDAFLISDFDKSYFISDLPKQPKIEEKNFYSLKQALYKSFYKSSSSILVKAKIGIKMGLIFLKFTLRN